MSLRRILLVLSLLAFLSASAGGTLYYTALHHSALEDAERQAVANTDLIKRSLNRLLTENRRTVVTLAGIPALREALVNPDTAALNRANSVLDHFAATLEADVCYLMNRNGLTIASSNRAADDSFVGCNFSFRPYFRAALRGRSGIYMAVGSTSGKRGVYTSYPVYSAGGGPPIGVAVIKSSIAEAEKAIGLSAGDLVLITAPQGIIFITNRPHWLYQLAWKPSSPTLRRIGIDRQFGAGPRHWIGLSKLGEHLVQDRQGNRYLMHQAALNSFPGWEVIHLRSMRAIARSVSGPLLRVAGPAAAMIALMIGLSVLVLYRKASHEIRARLRAEESLRLAKEKLGRYSRELEREVRIRSGEISAILKYTPNVVYIKDMRGRYLMVNSRFEALFGVKNEAVRGKTDADLLPADVAIQFRHHDAGVLHGGPSVKVEEHIPHEDGVHTYLSVKFPIFVDSGRIRGICGISTDITALKKAQEQLRRLSGSVMANQEKERAAIARELHDELGQLLTALRMDAVWLQERLGKNDDPVAARAGAMCALIDTTIEEVRGMAIRLRPGVLDDLGLVDALEWFTNEYERRAQIPCIFTRRKIPAVDNAIATAAYRIAQEALTNVARHANASRAEVTISTNAQGALVLEVIDDGRGFDPEQFSENDMLGQVGMRERAALVGGSLTVRSRPGQGTEVRFRVPLPSNSGRYH
jgi:PAS domain S-box-containing protein